MGLDVYLYRYEDYQDAKKKKAQYEKFSEKTWKFGGRKYEQLTQAEKDSASAKTKAFALSLGLREYGDTGDKIEKDSTLHPEHIFKIGYFRSSYNGSGINSYFRRIGLTTLDDIFEVEDQYEFQPDWEAALERVTDAILRYGAFRATDAGRFDCFSVHGILWPDKAPKDEQAALAIFLEQLKQHADRESDWSAYGNGYGEFDLKGMKVFAIIPGTNFLGNSTYIVYEKTQDKEGDFYLQALEIVRETIEFVLAQPDKEKYWLHWSG